MKFKKLVLSAVATSVLVGAPLSCVAKPNDRLDQRLHYHSYYEMGAAEGDGCFNEERIDENIPYGKGSLSGKPEVDYNKQENEKAYKQALIYLTAIQHDVERRVAFDWKLPEITSKAYVEDFEVEVPEVSKTDDSKSKIIHQKDIPELRDKTSQQLAHDWQEKTREKTVALVCANAQYRLGRLVHSDSHEEANAHNSVNGIDYVTSPNESNGVYYGDGRKGGYNPKNGHIMDNVTFFKDECVPAISGFRCGVCKRLQEDPNALRADDLMQANLLFHAAADKDQVEANGGRGYFYDEHVHNIKVCAQEGCKWLVLKPYGTGSFAVNPDAALAQWYSDLNRAFPLAQALDVGLIIADSAPKAPEPADKNAFINEQKRITKHMLSLVTIESPVAGPRVDGPWGI